MQYLDNTYIIISWNQTSLFSSWYGKINMHEEPGNSHKEELWEDGSSTVCENIIKVERYWRILGQTNMTG